MATILANELPMDRTVPPWARLPNEIKCQVFRTLLDSFTMVPIDVIGWCLSEDPLFRQAYSCAWDSRSCAAQIRAVCCEMARTCPPSYCELPGPFSWAVEQAEKSVKWHRLRAALYCINILQQDHDEPENSDILREGSSVLTATPHVGGDYFIKVTLPYLVDV